MHANEATRQIITGILSVLFPGEAFYVVLQSHDPPALCKMPNAAACTGRTFDVELKPWLESRGEYQGRRPAIWYDDVAMRDSARLESAGDAELEATLFKQLLAATTCHEAGHVADVGIDLCEPTQKVVEFASAIAAYSVAVHKSTTSWPPFYRHEGTFVRLAIHAWHRARKAGYESPVDWLFSGAAYSIAEPSDFQNRMECELDNLARVPLFDIPKFRPRHYFHELWQRCDQFWIDEHPESPAIGAARAMLVISQKD